MSGRILIIEDEKDLADIIEEVAVNAGFDVRTASGPEQIEAHTQEFKPDIVIMDLLMPDMDGIEVLQHLRQHLQRADIIIISGSAVESREMAQRLGQALGLNIIANFGKPLRIAELRQVLSNLKQPAARSSTA